MRALFICFIVAIAGCSVLTSHPQNSIMDHTQGLRYNLPKAYVNLVLSHRPAGTYPEAYGIEVKPVLVPDSEAAFYLDYHPSILSSDKVTIATSSAGLLTKIETIVEDQTDAIILKVIETAKEAAKAVAVAAVGEPIAEFTFDPAEINQVNSEISTITSGAIAISIDPPMESHIDKSVFSIDKCDGVVVRIPEVRTFHASSSKDGVYVTPSSTIMVLPSPTRLVCIDLRRAAMVEKITNITFDSGMPTEIHLEKPSEALAFVEIPLTAAKTLASLPTELLQVKIDYSSKAKELAEKRKAELEAKKALVDAINNSKSGSEPETE